MIFRVRLSTARWMRAMSALLGGPARSFPRTAWILGRTLVGMTLGIEAWSLRRAASKSRPRAAVR